MFEIAGANWRAIADVEGRFGSNLLLYAEGYRQGAELLTKHVLETGNDQDFLVYPILFLYRQHVELRLKGIAVQAARLLDRDPPANELMERHALEPLWSWCRELLTEIGGGPVDDLNNAERTVKQLAWADPGSFSFRYPTDKRGRRSLPTDLRQIDLDRVHNVMAGVANLLAGIVDFIDQQQEWKREMQDWCGP